MGMGEPPYFPDGLPLVKTKALIERGERPLWKRDLDFSELIPLARDYYLNALAGHSVPSRLGDVEIIAERWGKIEGSVSPDKLRLVPFIREILRDAAPVGEAPAKKAGAARQGVKRHFLRAAVELDGKTLDVTLSVQEASNGTFFFNLTEFGEFGREGKRNPPDSSGGSAASGDKGGSKGDDGAYSSFGNERRQPEHSSVSSTPQAVTNIAGTSDAVNLSVRDITPDWTPEPPLREAPPPTPEERALADASLEAEAQRLMLEGRAAQEETAALERAAADLDAVNREEEAILSVLQCVAGVL
jgi:hypothetical protein